MFLSHVHKVQSFVHMPKIDSKLYDPGGNIYY